MKAPNLYNQPTPLANGPNNILFAIPIPKFIAANPATILTIKATSLGFSFMKLATFPANSFKVFRVSLSSGAMLFPISARALKALFLKIFNWLVKVFNLSSYSPLTLSFSDTACFALSNFSLTPSKFSDNTDNPLITDLSLPKISLINADLSATSEFLILSSTFKIVPSAFSAISLFIVLGSNPKFFNASALFLVLAPWESSEYNLPNTVLVCSAVTPVDIRDVANAMLDSLDKFIDLANPPVLADTSASCAAVTE